MDMTRWIGRALASASLCALTMAPASASAQESNFEEGARLVTTIGILSVTTTVTYFVEKLSDRLIDKIFEDAHRYMREHYVALQADIALGSGQALMDLAAVYGVAPEERAAFAKRARSVRRVVLPMLEDGDVDQETARVITFLLLTEAQLARLS